ncbi:MAG: CvpA family protein [Pseudohongiella sp.]|jgi:membrane protein required for colicin V production
MNEVDAAILIIIVLSCLFGLWRGLIKEVLSLLTWVAALLVARVYSEVLAEMLSNVIGSAVVRYLTAFAVLFVVVMMLGTLLNHLMSKLLTVTGPKFADRLLGGVFGVGRGALIVLVILVITGVFVSKTEQWRQSVLIPYGQEAIEWLRILVGDTNAFDLLQQPNTVSLEEIPN